MKAPSPENIYDLVSDVIAEVGLQYQSVKFELSATRDANAHVQDLEFSSIISNLLHNAAEATAGKRNARVEVTIGEANGAKRVLIKDNGVGIPDNVVSQIGCKPISFGKGERGNGLGLYNASEWAQRNRGYIKIASQVGFGTQIILSFI